MPQLEQVLQQLPSQANNGMTETIEQVAGHLTAQGHTLANMFGGSSSPSTTPSTIKQALSPGNMQHSLSTYGIERFRSDQVKTNVPAGLIYDPAFAQQVSKCGEHTTHVQSGSEHTAAPNAQTAQPWRLPGTETTSDDSSATNKSCRHNCPNFI